jgi:S-adenosylmethionine decarboxylase
MTQPSDHFKQDAEGSEYAGDHLLVEFWGVRTATDLALVQEALEAAAAAAGATVLHSHYHRFGDSQGVSGVSVLAESHLTLHTWPERNYVAIDIFMCGDCDPYDCLPMLEHHFAPTKVTTQCIKRGVDAEGIRQVA